MAQAAECIEFTIDELHTLQQASNLAFVLKICFLYGSDEAFHALCAIVEYGKDLSATSKRIKRDARVELYKKVVATQYPHAHDAALKHLSYYEFATALTTFSDRWSSQFPFDELLSLAFIVDKEEQGEITLEVFFAFIDDVDRAFHSNPSYPNVALDAYYDGRRETLFKHVMVAFESVELRNKLAYLASLACQFHVLPLTALFDMLATAGSEEEITNEQIVGFIVQLTGTVNHGIKQLEAAHVLVNDFSPDGAFSPFSAIGGSEKGGKFSPVGSVASSNGNERLAAPIEQNIDSSFVQQEMSQQSYTAKIFSSNDSPPPARPVTPTATRHPDRAAESTAPTQQQQQASIVPAAAATDHSASDVVDPPSSGSAPDSPPASVDLLEGSGPVSTASTPRSPGSIGSSTRASSLREGETGAAVHVPPASAVAILEAVQAFQEKAQQMEEHLTPGPKSVASSSSPALQLANADPESAGADPGTQQQGDAGAEVGSIAAPSSVSASAAASSVPPAVLPHVLLQQLQQMEAQLSKARQLMLPIVGAAALHRENAVNHNILALAPPSPQRQQLTRQASAGAQRSPTPLRKLSLMSPDPLAGISGLFSPTPGSSAKRSGSIRRGSLLLDASVSRSMAHPSSAPMSARKFMELNQSHSRSIGATGKIDRSSPLVRHVDLSIFKSPLNHKPPEPRNVFDNAKLTWVPDPRSRASSRSSSRARERFQSTRDLMVAREINPVFFRTKD